MKSTLLVLALCALLAGCALAPDETEPSWTDARLSDSPPAAAPAYIERAVLSDNERLALAQGAAQALAARERVRLTGAALRAPTVDTAQFVVEARARALPPQPDPR